MLQRKIQQTIKEHFTSKSEKVLIIDGARQVGKSFIIRHEGKALFEHFIEINLIDDKRTEKVFEQISSVKDFYFRLSTVAGDKMTDKAHTLVFLDEIQAYPDMLTLLKFLKDDDRFTYIASGSLLGITLNKTLSQPAGRIRIVHMYPLDFEEFLWANHVGEEAISYIKTQFANMQSLDEAMHRKLSDLFKKYLLIGGLPDAVNAFINTNNIVKVREIHDEIKGVYEDDASKYDKGHSLKIKRIYGLVPSYLENRKKRIYYKDIEGKKGGRSIDYAEELEYLVHSGITIEVNAISNPTFPLIESAGKKLLKLYLNDVGLLTNTLYRHNINAVMNDERSVNLGSVYESVVASELLAHGFNLYYYDNKAKGEVDFLIDDYDSLSAVPIEVKSGKDYTTHRALDKFVSNKDYHIQKAYIFSNERTVRQEGKYIYMPVYYAPFLAPNKPKQVLLT